MGPWTHGPMGLKRDIFDILPISLPRIISIGRLDINSEGLLLLTNNGDLARFFELPKNKIQREYLVKVRGLVDNNKLELLKDGIKNNMDTFVSEIVKLKLGNSVVVDCTASSEIYLHYIRLLKNNISVVTPNKKANSEKYVLFNKPRLKKNIFPISFN